MRFPGFQAKADRNNLQRRRLWTGAGASILELFVISGLALAQPGGVIRGTVKTIDGRPVPHATVSAKTPHGLLLVSTVTDDLGRFRLPPVKPGRYTVEIRCSRCRGTRSRTIVMKGEGGLELTFVARTSEGPPEKSDSLGPVSLYTKPDFKTGELKDPSAGGGYSDSASAQTSRMVNQFLAREPGSPAKQSGNIGNVKAGDSESEEVFESLGRELLASRDYTRAVSVFERGVARYPRSERLQMGLGLSLYGAGKYESAVRALCDSARLAPDDPSPLLMIAEASQFVPSLDTAAAGLLRHFSVQHPKVAAGRYAYGTYLLRSFRSGRDRKNLEAAQTELEAAVALDQNDAATHLELGMVYDEEGLTAKAIREYEEAVRIRPELVEAHYRLSQDYERRGMQDKAAAEAARYQELKKTVSQ